MPITNQNESMDFDVNSIFKKGQTKKSNQGNQNKQNKQKKKEVDKKESEIQILKERIIKSISFELLSEKIPIIAIGYFDTLNEKTGFAVEIDGELFNAKQIIYGPFYTKDALHKWLSSIDQTFSSDDFIFFEVYILSSFIDSIELKLVHGKVKEEELEIGIMEYDGKPIPKLKYKL